MTSQVVAQEGQIKSEIQQFKSDSDARINEHQKSIEHLKSLLPYEEMTMEDYRDAFPDVCEKPIKISLALTIIVFILLIYSKLWIRSTDQHSGPMMLKNKWKIRMSKVDIKGISREKVMFNFLSPFNICKCPMQLFEELQYFEDKLVEIKAKFS